MSPKLCVVLLSLAAAGCAKVVVIPVANAEGEEGVFYALPKTVARVLVKVDREVKHPAAFSRFAPIFAPDAQMLCDGITGCLPDKHGVVAEVVKYSVQQGATITPFGEPDPTKVFLVKFAGSRAVDQALSMTWNEAGLLSAASATVTNRTTDIAMSTATLVAGLGTKAAFGADEARTFGAKALCPDGQANDKWVIPTLRRVPLPPPPPQPRAEPEAWTQILVENYCDLPPTDRDTSKPEVSRDDYSESRDKAHLARAVEIYGTRVVPMLIRRTEILTAGGGNMLNPVALIDKLDVLIDDRLKSLFIGSTAKKTWEGPFEVRDLLPGKPVILLGLHASQGVCPARPLLAADAKPLPSGFSELTAGACLEQVALSTDYHPVMTSQLFHTVSASIGPPPSGDRSFRYMLPAQVKGLVVGTLKDEKAKTVTREYGAGVFSVAQLGRMVSLPARRNSKMLTYDLAMIEATGGLKTFKLGTTGALDAGTIDAISGVGGTIFDARNAERKEREAERKDAEKAADELTILTRQSTLLKLKDEICELQKKYGLACTIQP